MAAANQADWAAIEGAFRSGRGTLREIASAHGITEGAIRARAKKLGWTRDPEGTKREKVKARLSGFTQNTTQSVESVIEQEAQDDERDMRLGLRAARLGLQVAAQGLEHMCESGSADAKTAKVWSECIAININTIRRIRGLDEATAPSAIVIDRSFGQQPP
jgi:hypothetical protein